MVDLSNSFFNNPNIPSPVLPARYINPTAPDTVIARTAQGMQNVSVLQFPNEIIKYYIDISIGDYQTSFGGIGDVTVDTKSVIRLPLPDQLKDIQSENWTQANLLAEAFSVAGGIVKGLALLGGAAGAGQTVAAGAAAAARVGGYGYLAQAGFQFGGDLLRLSGIAPNQFITILFNSPEYKQYTLSWTLSAKTPGEAETLRKIIQLLNNAMAPGLGTGNLYWTFPSIFQLFFAPCSRPYLYQFKPAVLVKFAVDYAAGHVPSFRRADTNTSNLNPPEAVILTAQFLEIEYWKNGDFGGGQSAGVRQQSPSLSQAITDITTRITNMLTTATTPTTPTTPNP